MWLGKQSRDDDFATMQEIRDLDRRLDALEGIPTPETYDDTDIRSKLSDLTTRVVALEERNSHLQDLTPRTYTLEYRNGGGANNAGTEFRRQMFTYGKIGVIKLDFRPTTNGINTTVAQLPADAPRFTGVVEVTVDGGGTVFTDGRSNAGTIEARGLTAGQRYIVNLIGILR